VTATWPYVPPAVTLELNSHQRQYLKGLAHHLDPVVALGTAGLNEATVAAAEQALSDHELIKVKFGKNFPDELQTSARELADALSAALCQVIGRIAVLYRPSPIREKRKIVLPER
jgi:RNA-binding protein